MRLPSGRPRREPVEATRARDGVDAGAVAIHHVDLVVAARSAVARERDVRPIGRPCRGDVARVAVAQTRHVTAVALDCVQLVRASALGDEREWARRAGNVKRDGIETDRYDRGGHGARTVERTIAREYPDADGVTSDIEGRERMYRRIAEHHGRAAVDGDGVRIGAEISSGSCASPHATCRRRAWHCDTRSRRETMGLSQAFAACDERGATSDATGWRGATWVLPRSGDARYFRGSDLGVAFGSPR